MKNVEDSDYVLSDDVDTVKAEKILQVKEQVIYIILTLNGLFVSGWKMMKVVIKLQILSMKISTQLKIQMTATSFMMIDKLEDEEVLRLRKSQVEHVLSE